VFNQRDFSEESTLLLSEWLKHTPPEILQQNFGLIGQAHPLARVIEADGANVT
jgi:oxalate decarboxylase